ncbi:hypothetical protein AX774_g199 [Zancudomyces culisetae]|uniref:Uncharacterized protein n=1 Tax=Zancudomyces culisetae TaxID=1213189 RepID=A0A1R1PZF0_ZANCU|nr:hypothetical protein AX774_g199 [Zancudomyces culisetae]|eukprot:OMH86307.1 hypothetical protein AX774_g199 [Zancudomyces culisetae]
MLNWIKSEKDIGETVDDDGFGCRCFSLGKRAPEFDLTDDMVVSTVFKHIYVSLFPNVIAQLDSLFNESVFNPI